MATIALRNDTEEEPSGFGPEFEPLTRLQAQQLSERLRSVSPWKVIAVQTSVGMLLALATWGLTGRSNAGWSAAYGVLAVVIPAALFARGLMSRFSSLNAATAGFGFFVWEAVKIAASVGMLFAAPRVIVDLDWLALLVALIVTMKMYWLAWRLVPRAASVLTVNRRTKS
jgi:ATP synthase protein I